MLMAKKKSIYFYLIVREAKIKKVRSRQKLENATVTFKSIG